MLWPILSAVSESFATVTDKFNLNSNKINGKIFTSLLFLFMGLVSIPLLYFFKAGDEAFTLFPLIILVFIIIGSAVQNILFYIGLENKNLSHIEPIRNSEPILVILIAFLVYPSERNLFVFILGMITTLAIIYSHMEKNKRKQIKIIFDKFTFFVLGSMFISALLNVGYKYILKYYSPFSLYVIRAISVGILLLLIFRPKIKLVTKKQVSLFTFSALLYSAAAIFQYISISRIGISITILLLSLSPSIVYILSMLLLKEKLSKNKIISSVIIISCAVAAVVLL